MVKAGKMFSLKSQQITALSFCSPLYHNYLQNMRVHTNSSDRIFDPVANKQLTRRGKSSGIQVPKDPEKFLRP